LSKVTDALLPCSVNPHQLTIPDQGWRLWADTQAPWQNDTLYLPSEVNLGQLPVNAPTGGWGTLNPFTGMSVSLPASVEEYYWGKLSSRPYTSLFSGVPEYAGFGSGSPLGVDLQVSNGAYRGVSWFWRYVNVPAYFSGKEVTLHLRSFRQRVEVYVNQQLVDYSLIAETATRSDLWELLVLGLRFRCPADLLDPL
jgi:beta-galactosidase